VAFVGIFGGLAAFGLMGLFMGPVIMAAQLASGYSDPRRMRNAAWEADMQITELSQQTRTLSSGTSRASFASREMRAALGHAQPAAFRLNGFSDGGLTRIAFRHERNHRVCVGFVGTGIA